MIPAVPTEKLLQVFPLTWLHRLFPLSIFYWRIEKTTERRKIEIKYLEIVHRKEL